MEINILSERSYCMWPSYFIVYEWENVMADVLGCNIYTFGDGKIAKIKRGLERRWVNYGGKSKAQYVMDGDKYNLFWVMSAAKYNLLPMQNVIPIYLDFPDNMVDTILYATERLPVFFVTCKDILNMMVSKGATNVRFMPLSISDEHLIAKPEKSIDVIQFGRKNEILHEYMLDYCKRNPDVEYVFQTENASLVYCSTTRGEIGKFDTRKEYLDLIKKCRISLVSTPGSEGHSRFGNIDFVTPRFYESAAFYCRLLGRYTDNEETRDLHLSDVCPNVRNYTEFEEHMDRYLRENGDWKKQMEFIQQNLTSRRAEYFRECLEERSTKL